MLLHSGMTRQEIVCESKTVVFNIKCDSQVLDFLSFHYLFGPWAIIISSLIVDTMKFFVILMLFEGGFSMLVISMNQPYSVAVGLSNNADKEEAAIKLSHGNGTFLLLDEAPIHSITTKLLIHSRISHNADGCFGDAIFCPVWSYTSRGPEGESNPTRSFKLSKITSYLRQHMIHFDCVMTNTFSGQHSHRRMDTRAV